MNASGRSCATGQPAAPKTDSRDPAETCFTRADVSPGRCLVDVRFLLPVVLPLLQKRPKLPERLAAMADRRLATCRHLGERASERRVEEDWVVAEAVGPARR